MQRLREIVQETNTRTGLLFDLSIQLLIFMSLIGFAVETLPTLSESSKYFLSIFEVAVIALFTIEYVLRWLVSESKLKFTLSFWGLIDLVAILPFYLVMFGLGFGYDLVMLRTIRLLRLVRLVKIARYTKSIARLGLAMKIAREDLMLALGGTAVMLCVASFGIYQFENPVQPDKFTSVFDSLWWSIATLTTVGYGDIYAITIGGKIFTGFILIIGLGIVALPAGIIASSLTEARKQEDNLADKDH
jgi:voltage-gated potassium channel